MFPHPLGQKDQSASSFSENRRTNTVHQILLVLLPDSWCNQNKFKMTTRRESPAVNPRRRITKYFRSQLRLGVEINGDSASAMVAVGDSDAELTEKTIKELRVARGSKGGHSTRDENGDDYFSCLSQKRKVKSGWPKGKSRKSTSLIHALRTINHLNLNPAAKQMFESMILVGMDKQKD
jgi:hypothetical protein